MVNLQLTDLQFRRLLDMVYVGNWILNSTREDDRIRDYDDMEGLIFSQCLRNGAERLCRRDRDRVRPSEEYVRGGIHEAIMDYEDAVFYEILAEELARRDISREEPQVQEDECILDERILEYIEEFEENGIENITLEK